MISICLKRLFLIVTGSLLAFMSTGCFALPFSVVPIGSLPTVIISGQTLKAFYTVTNNTVSQRNSNYVKYLPPNVSQVLSDPSVSNLCGATFNLSATGSSGDSCTLELNVTGPVNASAPSPHNHLFVCFPGGKTCAGTNYPLNVSSGTEPQYTTYIANEGEPPNDHGHISICTSSNSCFTYTDDTINTPQDIIINNQGTIAYVMNAGAGGSKLSICPVNSATGTIGTCNDYNSLSFAFRYGGLTLINNYLYLTNTSNRAVDACAINPDGSLGQCYSNTGGFHNPTGRVGINLAGTVAYVANFGSASGVPPGFISICTILSTGNFGSCTEFNDPTITSPLGAYVSPQGTYLYVANLNQSVSPNASTVVKCAIGAQGQLSNCIASLGNGTFNFIGNTVTNLFISNTNVAYVPNNTGVVSTNSLSVCPVNSDGSFGTCTAQLNSTFDVIESAWVIFGAQ